MSAHAYVDGRYGPVPLARVAIEDRGLQFGDSVYEVVALFNGQPFDWDAHDWRLRRNLAALMIEGVAGPAALRRIADTLVRRARVRDGLIYLQVSRGTARRDHVFPRGTRPTLMLTARSYDFRRRLAQQAEGVAVLALPDQRWLRCDIKTTNLLGAVLAKEEAHRAGAAEAMFHLPDETVTEGASTNMWLVDDQGRLVTHPLSSRILPGIMRATAMRLAQDAGLEVIERPFTLAEARAAAELFFTATTAPVMPVTRLDGAPVANGVPGPVTRRLAALLAEEIHRQTGWRA